MLARRIDNESHRHEIRSHVMRGVRQQELSVGKKRPPKIGPSTKPSRLARRSFSRQRRMKDESLNLGQSPSPSTSSPSRIPSLSHDPSCEYLDPFAVLPEAKLPASEVNKLIMYGLNTFFPMSFPVEKSQAERQSRLAMLLAVQRQSHVAFIAFLATVALHRAVIQKKTGDLAPHDSLSRSVRADLIRDRAYWCTLDEAVAMVNQSLASSVKVDSATLEACFSIVSAACIAGDFQQASDFLKYVTTNLSTVDVSEHARAWLLLTDIKTAVGLLRRPIKELPWSWSPVPDDVLERVCPSAVSPTSRLGTVFANLTSLTSRLHRLLADATLLCHFCEFNTLDAAGLTTHEHIIYRCKNHELEHDVLSYVYHEFHFKHNGPQRLAIPALEHVIRLGVLGLYSAIATAVHPGTGLGRHLTHHQKHALSDFGLQLDRNMNRAELEIMIWVLFVFAQGSEDQVEEPEFEYLLAHVCDWLGIADWPTAEDILLSCLYVPSVQRGRWKKIWFESQKIKVEWAKIGRKSGLVDLRGVD